MTALLLACLLLCADEAVHVGDDAPPVDLAAAQRDSWRALERRLTEQLEALPEGDPETRKALLVERAAMWCQLGEPAKAIEDCNAAIVVDPAYVRAYSTRAAAHLMQGQSELAEADRSKAIELVRRALSRHYHDGYSYREAYYEDVPLSDLLPVPAWLFHPAVLLAEVWGLVTVIYLAVSWRQRVEGGGTIRRWLWVSAAAAAMAVLPYALWAFMAVLEARHRPDHGLALLATVASTCFVALSLRPPVWLRHAKRQLQLVDDEAFLARVEELAGKMRIAVPRVRLLRSTSEAMEAQAFAGGLPAPTLIVTDGVLHRLDPAERDGVVAHEMAHVANRSLWLLTMTGPVACTAALATSAISYAWYLFGFAVFIGLRRIVSRLVEPDCDRRAAEAIGYRETVSALAKIHAVNPIPQKGWLSVLIYATATHPPREVRLAALQRRAPSDDRPTLALSIGKMRWHRWLSFAALVVWLAALSTPLVAWWYPEWAGPAALALLLVAVTPLALLGLGLRRYIRRAKRRMAGLRSPVGYLRTLVILIALVMVFAVGPIFEPHGLISGWGVFIQLAALVALLVAILWPRRTTKLRRKVAVALQLHDFQQVVQLQQTAPKRFARDPVLRHNFAVAAGLTGDRARAIAELEGLRRDKPRFKLPWLVLGTFYLDDGNCQRALEIAEQAAVELKDDPAPHALAARALRRLGRTAAARAAIERVLAMEPEAGDALALAAAIVLDLGDAPRAAELLEKAQEHAPGDATVLVAQAELALATEPLDAARSAVQQALKAVEANPFVLLDYEADHLQTRLRERESQEGASVPPSAAEGERGDPPE